MIFFYCDCLHYIMFNYIITTQLDNQQEILYEYYMICHLPIF